MLSWLLRHGIKHKSVTWQQIVFICLEGLDLYLDVVQPAEVGLNSESADGWVKVTDVLASEYFKEITKEILMKARLRAMFRSGSFFFCQASTSKV